MPARCNDAEHTLYRAGGTRRALPFGAAPRVLYLDLRRVHQNFGGNPVPKALLQGLQFNGNGTVTVPFGTVNIGGTIVFDVSGSEGTYTVNADCTGTMLFGGLGGPSFNMYIGPGAQQLWITQTGGGPGDGTGLGVGTATRQPE